MKVFIGNLAETVSEDDLSQAASAFGKVSAVSITLDDEGKSKGFGFVEMSSAEEMQALMAGLQGKELQGQALKLTEARPEKRGGRSNASRSPGTGFGSRPVAGSKTAKGSGSKGGFNIGTTGRNKV
jgi:RNA recognition motif-containing protein